MDEGKLRLDRLLMPLLGTEELVERWWQCPNRAFDNDTPISTYNSNPQRVVNYILGQYNSDYS